MDKKKITQQINKIAKMETKLDDFNAQLDTIETEKVDKDIARLKSENIDLDDMSERALQAIQGGQGTSFNLLSIPRDKSVTPSKTTFITSPNNSNLLENHNYIDGQKVNANSPTIVSPDASFISSEIIAVEKNTDYNFNVDDKLFTTQFFWLLNENKVALSGRQTLVKQFNSGECSYIRISCEKRLLDDWSKLVLQKGLNPSKIEPCKLNNVIVPYLDDIVKNNEENINIIEDNLLKTTSQANDTYNSASTIFNKDVATVGFIVDDGYNNDDVMVEIANKNGIKLSFSLFENKRMDKYKEYYKQGHGILAHGYDNNIVPPNLSTNNEDSLNCMSDKNAIKWFKYINSVLRNNGLPCNGMVYFNNVTPDEHSKAIVSRFYRYAFGSVETVDKCLIDLNDTDVFNVNRVSFLHLKLDQLKQCIDKAILERKPVIFWGHSNDIIGNTGTDGENIQKRYEDLCAYIKTKIDSGLIVPLSVDDIMRNYYGSLKALKTANTKIPTNPYKYEQYFDISTQSYKTCIDIGKKHMFDIKIAGSVRKGQFEIDVDGKFNTSVKGFWINNANLIVETLEGDNINSILQKISFAHAQKYSIKIKDENTITFIADTVGVKSISPTIVNNVSGLNIEILEIQEGKDPEYI